MVVLVLGFLVAGHSRASAAAISVCDAESRLAGSSSILNRWQHAVRARRSKQTKLQYPMSSAYYARFLRLPYTLEGFGGTQVHLTYIDQPQSIVPVMRHVESWHAIVRYLEGYNYVLSFPDAGLRTSFLKKFPHVQIPDGELDGRYTVMLTPAQFSALSEAVDVRGLLVEQDGLRPSTWNEIKSLDWVSRSTAASGSSYFFDRRGAVVGLRRGRHFFVVESRSAGRTRAAASHAEILKRQNPALDINRFLLAGGEIPGDFGLNQASRELERIEAALDQHLAQPNFASSLLSLNQLQTDVMKASSLSPHSGGFSLSRLINYRLESLKMIASESTRILAGDVTKDRRLVCQGPSQSTQVIRFVWIKDLEFGNGLLFSRRNELMHYQMLALATGRPVLEKLVGAAGVRGGTLAVHFDREGNAKNFTVDRGDVRVLVADGGVREIAMTSAERQSLALSLFNFCQEHLRNPNR